MLLDAVVGGVAIDHPLARKHELLGGV